MQIANFLIMEMRLLSAGKAEAIKGFISLPVVGRVREPRHGGVPSPLPQGEGNKNYPFNEGWAVLTDSLSARQTWSICSSVMCGNIGRDSVSSDIPSHWGKSPLV